MVNDYYKVIKVEGGFLVVGPEGIAEYDEPVTDKKTATKRCKQLNDDHNSYNDRPYDHCNGESDIWGY